ncbi:MAG: hypothetical protein JRH15_20835 [Deltaproteobacteria bacterium]|nr:hypothetical protein [Deltaproteobacteria bacterium]
MKLVLNPILVMVALVMMVVVTAGFCEESTEKQDTPQYTANNGSWAHTEKTREELKWDNFNCMAEGKEYLSTHGGAYADIESYWTRCMEDKGYVKVYKPDDRSY